MGIRIHPRNLQVTRAKVALLEEIFDYQREYDLTNIELLQALHEAEASILKYMLRVERHGDETIPAGEA